MAQFIDSKQRTWDLTITGPLGLRIRQNYDPKFLLGPGNETLERIAVDPVLFACILYVLCDKQRIERGISEEDFYEEISGPAFDNALPAVGKAIISFTRDPRIRRALELVIQHQQAFQDKALGMLEQTVSGENLAKLEEEMLAKMASLSTRSTSATVFQDSAESVPTDASSAS